MKRDIVERLAQLRAYMQENALQAFIVVSSDAHSSEYVANHWKSREWISGFDGSAGTAVITLDDARLWTDSRYWLAAEEQL
ncbi:MAG: aminopeptidase P family N-terminal domain-containing protein, partial [Bacteroidaceae bacterium]|nr:aminopeptidase P family N-terminal domain-containing protein [Bacteroidaceae bacterium]